MLSRMPPACARAGLPRWLVLLAAPFAAGCDPIFEIDGAYFPAWLVCLVLAAFPLLAARWLLRRLRVEEHIPWRPLAYVSLYTAIVLGFWLGFYRT